MQICFKANIKKFGQQGEKTGWTYLIVPATVAQKLKPGNKKAFRIKGTIDDYTIASVAIMPMGDGSFILAVNALMRKNIRKRLGDTVEVKMELDNDPLPISAALVECLKDDPDASDYFYGLVPSHQYYFSKWIESAKTEQTKTRRLSHSMNCLARKMDYAKTLRSFKTAII